MRPFAANVLLLAQRRNAPHFGQKEFRNLIQVSAAAQQKRLALLQVADRRS
jgi:hypothetical protein